jgi:hypothetical protein
MRSWLLALGLLGVMACASKSATPSVETEVEASKAAEGEPVSVTNTLGPVTATVTVTPSSPLIGDVMSLTLRVDAKKGVELTMPESREAFSRLEIDDEDEGREAIEGGERYFQNYKIQAASSGRLRIPPMRLVFVDKRPASERQGEEAEGEERELLTDEVAIKVRPVLEGEEATDATLRPIQRPLEEFLGPSLWQRYWWAFVGGVFALASLVGLFFLRRGRKVAQVSPYERASVALSRLEAEGLPDEETRDGWYVQLSSIVRRYLEDRFALRAPELTTEEFLRVAQRSVLLSDEHKKLLSSFLADCDQVKFAGYEPGEEESRSVLEAARRFLLETRELDREQAPESNESDPDPELESEPEPEPESDSESEPEPESEPESESEPEPEPEPDPDPDPEPESKEEAA